MRAIIIAALLGLSPLPAVALDATAPQSQPAEPADRPPSDAVEPPLPVRATVALAPAPGISWRTATPQPAQEKPMQVTLVRLSTAACEPHCPQWIAAEGRIEQTTPMQFKKLFAKLGKRKLPLVIHSGGGSVEPALAIGRLLRARGMEIAVGRTQALPCDASDAACRKETASGIVRAILPSTMAWCGSACAFLLAGGTERHVGRQAQVGVHQITTLATKVKIIRQVRTQTQTVLGVPVSTKTQVLSEKRIPLGTFNTPTKDSAYENVRLYFRELGIDESIMARIKSTPGNKVHWLTRPELVGTRLATTSLTAADLIYRDVPKAPGVAGPAPHLPPISTGRPTAGAEGSPPDLFKMNSTTMGITDRTNPDRFRFPSPPSVQVGPPRANEVTTTAPRN